MAAIFDVLNYQKIVILEPFSNSVRRHVVQATPGPTLTKRSKVLVENVFVLFISGSDYHKF